MSDPNDGLLAVSAPTTGGKKSGADKSKPPVPESVAAAYRLRLGELKRMVNAGLERALKERGAATPNEKEKVGAAGAELLQAEVLATARQAVVDLARIHVRDSRASASEITAMIRKEYLAAGLEHLPGGALYLSSDGFGLTAEAQRLRQPAQARFENQRGALRREVEDIVITTLAEHPRKNLRERFDEWWKKSLVGGIVAVVLVLSTLGATVGTWTRWINSWLGNSEPAPSTAPRVKPVQEAAPSGSAVPLQSEENQ